MELNNLGLLLPAAIMYTKIIVDIFKRTDAIPTGGYKTWWWALLVGEIISFLLHAFHGGELTLQALAGVALTGIGAFGGAVGVTKIQQSSNS